MLIRHRTNRSSAVRNTGTIEAADPRTLSGTVVNFRHSLLLVLLLHPPGLGFGQDDPGGEAGSTKVELLKPQYEFEKESVPAAFADESILREFSVARAVEYIEAGNRLWWKKQNCVSCHTSGVYGMTRPALSAYLGNPDPSRRHALVADLEKMKGTPVETLRKGIRPTQIAYLAGALAEWDKHVTGKLSRETDHALRMMLSLQSEDGSFHNSGCWPPLESSAYHGATVAAMAVQSAPGWLGSLHDCDLRAKVARTHEYLRTTPPPHDYGRLLLLWASTQVPCLIDDGRKQTLIDMVLRHQQTDGGWSIRSFATPETWGNGRRAKKLRGEPEFANPPSDGHQTGLALLVLRDAGVPASDKRIQAGVQWLMTNQRRSGRWWTRSLNTDKSHFITYTGTCYPLLALSKCGVLSKAVGKYAAR